MDLFPASEELLIEARPPGSDPSVIHENSGMRGDLCVNRQAFISKAR